METIGLARNIRGTWDYNDPFFKDKSFVNILKTHDVFEWLDYEYKRRYTSQKSDNDYLIFADFKEVQEYDGSNDNYKGMKFARWLNNNVYKMEYLLVDLDDLQEQDEHLNLDEVERRFKHSGITFRLWPSFSHDEANNVLKYRAMVQLEKPIVNDNNIDVTQSKKQALDELSKVLNIDIIDDSNKTWRQAQGAPLAHRPYIKGNGIKLNNKIIKKKGDERLKVEMSPLNKISATQIINHYIERDKENLKEEFNCFGALKTLATSVQTGEITEEMAKNYAKKFASVASDEATQNEWAERNLTRLQKELDQIPNLDVWYTFEEKFKKTIEQHEKAPTVAETALELMDKFTFKPISFDNGESSRLGVYDDVEGIYHLNEEKIYRTIVQNSEASSRSKVKDVAFDIKHSQDSAIQKETPHLIPVRNGVYDLNSKSLIEHSEDRIFTSKIDTNYNPNAKNPKDIFDVDNWFREISCDDEEVELLLWQIINEAINGNHTRGKYFILYGQGANGKSTFLDMITHLVGSKNTSHMKIQNIQSRFGKQALVGKTVNLGDDITSSRMSEIDIIKNIATGDPVEIEAKGKDSYFMALRLALIFTANEVPKVDDTSQGNLRRRVIVPFNADFTSNGDANIRDVYIKDERVREYILKRALEVEFDKFIEPKVVQEANERQRQVDDSIYSFYKLQGEDMIKNAGIFSTKDYYDEYVWWVTHQGIDPESQTKVTRNTKMLLGNDWDSGIKYIHGKNQRTYFKK